MTHHCLRFHPPVCELKRLIAEGILGDIRRVDMALGYPGRQKAAEGVLSALGCHLIDLTLWIFGSIRHVEAVSAYEKGDGGKRDVLHSVNAVLDTGLLLSIRLSSSGRLENEMTVMGSLATCKVFFDSPTLVLHQSNTIALCKNKGARVTLRGARDQEKTLTPAFQDPVGTAHWIEKIYQVTRRYPI